MGRLPRELVERVTLEDGGRFLLRPLMPGDWRAVQRGFATLSSEDRRYRFFSGFSKLTDEMAKRLCTLDYKREMALTLFDLSRDPPVGVGIARLAPLPDGKTGEMAIVVLEPWRRRGIARLLLARLADWARRQGYRRICALTADDNIAMQHLAENLGYRVTRSPDELGVLDLVLELTPSASEEPRAGPAA